MRTAFIEPLLVEDFVLTVFLLFSSLYCRIQPLKVYSVFLLQFIALYLQVIFFGKKVARSFFFFLLALLKYDVSACTELTATEVMTL